jgi:hypothetical protein
MNKYLEFEESVLKTLSNCKVKIELYHLHFTIRNSDIKEIELKDDRIKVIKIHRMRLTPTITQYQTVYKNSLLSKIFDVAKKLFTLESIDLIGYKLECIVKYNLENIVNFPKFNYVELHFKKIDFKDFHNQSQKQLISFSYDNDCIVNAIRFPDDKSREEVFKDIEKWISFFNSTKANNIEISIYDGWSDNIEIDWIKLNDENCVNNMISLLSKNV